MKAKTASLFCLFSLLYFGISFTEVRASECSLYELTDVKTSGDLATLMGKHRLFDVDLMMKYDDDVILPQGEVVLLEHKLLKPEMALGYIQNGERVYRLSNGLKLSRNINGVRKLASEKQTVKLCKD